MTSFCQAAYEFCRGTITNGGKVTVKDDKGKSRIIIRGGATDIEVDDKIPVENGKITKVQARPCQQPQHSADALT